MKNWLISIAAFSTLSAVADMLLPRSSVSRYAKLCVSLILTAIIIVPVVNFREGDFSLDIPSAYDVIPQEDGNVFVDYEFSKRFTEMLQTDTGLNSIKVTAELGYECIKSLYITGVDIDLQPVVNKVLSEKYQIPAEIVHYG